MYVYSGALNTWKSVPGWPDGRPFRDLIRIRVEHRVEVIDRIRKIVLKLDLTQYHRIELDLTLYEDGLMHDEEGLSFDFKAERDFLPDMLNRWCEARRLQLAVAGG